MRVDLYLKLMGVFKTRMAAKRLCDSCGVQQGGRSLKPSQEILAGQTLELSLPQKVLRLVVLEVPSDKSVAKADRARYASLETLQER